MAELRIVFMDAGQGDPTLVVYPDNSLMLIDYGSTKSKTIVAPQIVAAIKLYLPSTLRGNTIHTLVLTHPDEDHYNVLNYVNTTLGIDKNNYNHVFYGGERTDYKIDNIGNWLEKTNNHVLGNCYADPEKTPNAILSRAGVSVWILAANVPFVGHKDKNTNSVVLLVQYKGVNIFLMGDATFTTEQHIIETYKKTSLLQPPGIRTALKVGHHGSARTSSSQEWIEAILPEVLFISSDTKRFGKTGTEIPNSTTINNIKLWSKKIIDFGRSSVHTYVQFNDTRRTSEEVSTQKAIYTTLYKLNPDPEGGSWHYVIKDDGSVSISTT